MATLPSPSDIQRQTPRSRMSIPNIQAGADERARIELGQSISRVGQIVGGIATHQAAVQAQIEDDRASVQAEDAMNQLAMVDVEIKAKLQTIRNGDAANQDLLGNFTKEREAKIKAIKAGMKNPQAISKFDTGVAKTAPRFGATVLQHQLTEAESYRGIVYQNGIQADAATVAQNSNNDAVISEIAKKRRLADEAEANRQGLNGTKPEDITARTEFIKNGTGLIYMSAIESRIQKGDASGAEKLLVLNREFMTQKQIDASEKLIRPNVDFANGKAALAEYYASLASGKTKSEAAKAIQEKSDKASYSIFKELVSDDEHRANIQGQETKGVLAEKFSRNLSASTMNAIFASPEYIGMPADDKASLANYMRQELEQAKNVSEAKKSTDPASFALYDATRNAPNFTSMSKGYINGLRPKIGNILTTQLLSEHSELINGAARFKIDPTLINDAIPPSALKDREKTAAFKGYITSQLMEFKAGNKGVTPTYEQQQKIIASASQEFITLNADWFGFSNKKSSAFEAGAKSAPKELFDALKDVPDDDVVAYYQAKKTHGIKVPAGQERAYFDQWKKRNDRPVFAPKLRLE